MRKLLSFEFYKRWKSYRIGLAGIVALQAILLLLIKILIILKAPDAPANVACIIYFLSLAVIMIIPPFESLARFNTDISGKVSVLELSLPFSAWKKVLSKLFVTICTIVSSAFICIVSFSCAFLLLEKSSDFKKTVANVVNGISSKPLEALWVVLVAMLKIAFFICMIYLCIAVAKAISHKNKIAAPIGFGLGIGYIIVFVILECYAYFWPIVTYKIYGGTMYLSSILIEVVLLALTFLATSWLVEKKIES